MAKQQTAAAPPGVNTSEVLLCSKCGDNPRADGDSNNPWCKECRAEYQRNYERLRLLKQERHGYAQGISDMRELLAGEFDRLGFAEFSAIEVRDLIRNAPGPKLPD